jgi:capsular polysaccharide biosynthesis protein
MTQDNLALAMIAGVYVVCGGFILFIRSKIKKQNDTLKEIKNTLDMYIKEDRRK